MWKAAKNASGICPFHFEVEDDNVDARAWLRNCELADGHDGPHRVTYGEYGENNEGGAWRVYVIEWREVENA